MNRASISDFFITSDSARRHTYWLSLTLACSLAAVLFLSGAESAVAAITGGLAGIALFAYTAILHRTATERRLSSAIAPDRAEIFRAVPFSRTPPAASVAIGRILSIPVLSTPEVTLSKAVTRTHRPRGGRTSAANKALCADENVPAAFREPPDREFLVENMTIRLPRQPIGAAPERECIDFRGVDGRFFVRNCHIVGFHQDLSAAVWVNVVFENCDIVATEESLTLLSVTFRSCSMDIGGDISRAFPSISCGHAQGITFLSRP